MTLRRTLLLLLLIILPGLFMAYAVLVYSDAPVDPKWALSGSETVPQGAVTVRFSGTATLLFSDGETKWMVDGWFSRPGPLRLLLGKPVISEPLVPPVSVFDYRLGKAYVLHVSHPKGTWLIVGSAGYVEGALEDFSADTIFLGVGGLGSQTADYREAFWRETVGRVAPQRVIPIHFDSLTAAVEGPFRGPVKAMSFLSGGLENTLSFLQKKEADNPHLLFNTLPRFDEVVLFE